MPRLAFDSDQEAALRGHVPDADMVFLYADVVTTDSMQYWGDRLVVIDRGLGDPLKLATVMDVESGSLTLEQAVMLFDQWEKEGRPFITGYASRDTMPRLDMAMGARQIWRWFATLDGTLRIPGHPDAMVQAFSESMLGFHADGTVVWNAGYRPAKWVGRALRAADIVTRELRARQ